MESPELFTRYVQELTGQCNGENGSFVLSQNDRIVEMSKYMEIIFNPLGIDINSKKIVNRLYLDLDKLAKQEEIYFQTQQMRKELVEYLLELEQRSEYILEIPQDIDMTAIFKAVGIKHEIIEENYLEKLIRYMKVVAQVLGIKVITFINLRSYLNDEQMEQLLKEAIYQEIQILLVENQERTCLKDIFRYIIDNDKCEIF
ncbi:type II-A CRISPR-associated protein Csn2 [Faecalimonas sp.]